MKLRRKYHTNKARSKKSEKEAAAFLGGGVQPASGALPNPLMKADVKSANFLVDDKVTDCKSYNVKFDLWLKLKREAFMNRKRPMIRINGPTETLYVIDELTLQEMMRGDYADE
jgi:hypothetical protein